jgi:aminodeoxyfutalosine deaminase
LSRGDLTPRGDGAAAASISRVPYPKIELHVHLEGTVRPAALLDIARRNGVPLPANSVDELAEMYAFRDFAHFIDIWILTTRALRTERDFRRIVVDYAHEAARHGAVYVEGIFSPAERVKYGPSWDEVFSGFCDGAQEARESTGVDVRLTPDIPRDLEADPLEGADLTVRYAAKYRDRGVVGVGLGGMEASHPPEPFAPALRRAKEHGLGSVPHAGEVVGPASVRGAVDALAADRVRHGIRAVDDPALLDELADRGIVLDVCPTSNVRTGAAASLEVHPLPQLLGAGVACSIGTDDPAMFDTDLGREHAAARSIGADARAAYLAGARGALCDASARERLIAIGDGRDWSAAGWS